MSNSSKEKLSASALETLFLNARSQNGFIDKPVSDDELKELYDIVKMGPTSMNCSPARFKFVRSDEEKAKLIASMAPPNKDKVSAAPVIVIIGMEMDFVETLPKLFPHTDVRPYFGQNKELIESTAFRNSSLQGAYLMLAARALGLDCGPMSGFDPVSVNENFWAGTNIKTNFVCTLGHGDPSKVFPRLPRLSFDEACSLV